MDRSVLKKISDIIFEIPKSYRADMRVPARIYADEKMLDDIFRDRSLEQLVNVATLPGIIKAAIGMPDLHEGYGFPIGGVAALDANEGIISPGGIGYDINCGVRLLTSKMTRVEIEPHLPRLATAIWNAVPSGVGRGGKIKLTDGELDAVLSGGARRMVALGYGESRDLLHSEENGCLAGADPVAVGSRAKNRGRDQIGTLGSGNHFLEVQYVEKIYNETAARELELDLGTATVMIHCGSRGLGHQVATDYIRLMLPQLGKYGITLPDRELACAPVSSLEGKNYFSAMAAAANFAWANRQVIAQAVRGAWKNTLGAAGGELAMLYDVAHNIGKREMHEVDGERREVIMHRKGATRAFGPGRSEIPKAYQRLGQPVLIPGTMGTASHVLVGTTEGETEAFGTSCHGAGRAMSRAAAKRVVNGRKLRQHLEEQGIVIRCDSMSGLAEEAPEAYKDVDNVVDIVSRASLARKVVRLKPLAVIKGG